MVGLEQSAVDFGPHAPLLRPLVTHTCRHVQQVVVFIYDGHPGGPAICLALVGGIFTASHDGHVLGYGCCCDPWSSILTFIASIEL